MSESASALCTSPSNTGDGTAAIGECRRPPLLLPPMLPATAADPDATTRPAGAGLQSPAAPAEEPPPAAEDVQQPPVNAYYKLQLDTAEDVQQPTVNAYYKLQLDTGEYLSGGDKSGRGARKLTVTPTSATASVFLLEAPAKGERGRPMKGSHTLFMCDGGYLRADAENKPISTTTANKGAK